MTKKLSEVREDLVGDDFTTAPPIKQHNVHFPEPQSSVKAMTPDCDCD